MSKKKDYFGNEGAEIFSVPTSFARGGTVFHFDVLVAADSEAEAYEIADKITETPVGQVYFSKDRIKHASTETIKSILNSIEGILNVTSDHTWTADYCLRADRRDDDDLFDEDGDDDDDDIQEDTFSNEGSLLYHVPMKYGTWLDSGTDVIVRFEVEIAANSETEARDRAENIGYDDFFNGVTIKSDSLENLKDSFEMISGVVFGTVTVSEALVTSDEFETPLMVDTPKHGTHLTDDEFGEDGEEGDEEDEDDAEDIEVCRDEFGYCGRKFWWVPMEFACEVAVEGNARAIRKFSFSLKIASDSEDEALRDAAWIDLDEITGNPDDRTEPFSGYTAEEVVKALNEDFDSTCEADWEDWDGDEAELAPADDAKGRIKECCI